MNFKIRSNIQYALAILLCYLPISVFSIDEIEPNDEFAQAQGVSVGDFIDGYGTPYDVDWYSFTVTDYGSIFLEIIELEGAVIASMGLFSSNEYSMESINNPPVDPTGSISRFCVAPATYYIKVQNGAFAEGAYGLDIQFYSSEATISEVPINSNDIQEEATLIELPEGVTTYEESLGFDNMSMNAGDSRDRKDWLWFFQEEKGALGYENFTQEIFNGESSLSADFFGKGGQLLTPHLQCLVPDSFFLRIMDNAFPGAQEVCNSYSIELTWESSVFPTDEISDFDDDQFEGAQPFPEGQSSVDGTLGYVKDIDGLFEKDQSDWWQFTLPESGIIQIDLVTIDPIVSSLLIADEEGEIMFGGTYESLSPQAKRWTRDCNSSGTNFFIHVSTTNNECGPYSLDVTLTPSEAEADDPGNDSFESAIDIELSTNYDGQLGFRDECGPGCVDHEDYYKFEFQNLGDITVTYEKTEDFYPSHSLFKLVDEEYIFVSPTEVIEDPPGLTGFRFFNYTCLEMSDYWIKTTDNVPDFNCRGYRFSVGVGEDLSQFAETVEEDPDFNALPLSSGSNNGLLGFIEEDELDTEDVWFIETEESGTVKFKLIPGNSLVTDGPGDLVSLAVFDANDEFIDPDSTVVTPDSLVWFACCQAKLSLLKVRVNSSFCGSYNLEYSLDEPLYPLSDADPISNGSFADAQAIEINTSYTGQIGYENACGPACVDELDFYKFENSTYGTLYFTVQFEDISENHDYPSIESFFQTDNMEYIQLTPLSNSGGYGHFSYIFTCAATGEYFFRITGNGNCHSYSTHVSRTESFPATAMENEPNDDFETSETLLLNTTHVEYLGFFYERENQLELDFNDYYFFSTTEFGNLNVKVTGGGHVLGDIEFFKNEFDFWTGFDTLVTPLQENIHELTLGCLNSGDYIFRIPYSGAGLCAPYTINLDFQPHMDTPEPNDLQAEATPINIGESITASILTITDSRDMYQFDATLNAGHELYLNVLSYDDGEVEGTGALSMTIIYDEEVQHNELFVPNTPFQYTFPDEASGTAYIDLSDVSSGLECMIYNLQVTGGSSNFGDLNGDGIISSADLLDFLSQSGCTSDCGTGDINGDGIVNTADLLILLSEFGP